MKTNLKVGLAFALFVVAAGGSAFAQTNAPPKPAKGDAARCNACIKRGMAGTGTGQTSGAPRDVAVNWCKANNFCK